MGRPMMLRRVYYPTRAPRLGDFFDDISNALNFSDLSVPSISDSGVINSPVDLSQLSTPSYLTSDPLSANTTSLIPQTSNSLVQFAPATADNSWQSILSSISKALPPLALAAGTVAQTNANISAMQAIPQAVTPSTLGQSLSSLISGPYGIYLIGGAFVLLALSVNGGSSGKRR